MAASCKWRRISSSRYRTSLPHLTVIKNGLKPFFPLRCVIKKINTTPDAGIGPRGCTSNVRTVCELTGVRDAGTPSPLSHAKRIRTACCALRDEVSLFPGAYQWSFPLPQNQSPDWERHSEPYWLVTFRLEFVPRSDQRRQQWRRLWNTILGKQSSSPSLLSLLSQVSFCSTLFLLSFGISHHPDDSNTVASETPSWQRRLAAGREGVDSVVWNQSSRKTCVILWTGRKEGQDS